MHDRPMALGAGPANIRAFRPCCSVPPQREALGKVGADCCVSFLTTTRALCVAGLQTRRRWLFVSPPLSLFSSLQTCKPFVARLPLLPRCDRTRLSLLPNCDCSSHSLPLRDYNKKRLRQQRHSCYPYRQRHSRRKSFRCPINHLRHCMLQIMHIAPS